MKIRNFIVENRALFIDVLEEELCKNGISYVKINNEIHFLDQIIRFYDIEIDKKEIITGFFTKQIKNEENELTDLLKLDMNFLSPDKEIKYTPIQSYLKITHDYQNRNRYIQKQESHKVKQQLKKYFK